MLGRRAGDFRVFEVRVVDLHPLTLSEGILVFDIGAPKRGEQQSHDLRFVLRSFSFVPGFMVGLQSCAYRRQIEGRRPQTHALDDSTEPDAAWGGTLPNRDFL
jgi:hypothetical protein